jgi:hypothetical protein
MARELLGNSGITGNSYLIGKGRVVDNPGVFAPRLAAKNERDPGARGTLGWRDTTGAVVPTSLLS